MKHLALCLLLIASFAYGQNLTTSGGITLQAAACSGAGAGYVNYQLPPTAAAVSIALSGTWSGTVQFVGSTDGTHWSSLSAAPLAGGSDVTSSTANGIWTAASGGLQYICTYASAYSSGTIAVAMSVNTNGGGQSGSASPTGPAGGVLSGAYPNPGYANPPLPLTGGTMTGTLTGADGGTWGSGGINGSAIGNSTPASGNFTTATLTGALTLPLGTWVVTSDGAQRIYFTSQGATVIQGGFAYNPAGMSTEFYTGGDWLEAGFDGYGNFGVGPSGSVLSDPFYVTTAGAVTAASLAVGPIIAAGTQTISGCSLASAAGGASAGSFQSGTSGTCTVTITPGNTATNGFRCSASDLTHGTDVVQQTATSTTTCTIAGTTVSGDLITWQAIAF